MKHEFDKIILLILMLAVICFLVLLPLAPELSQWLREIGSGVLGGLLGLITGRSRNPQTAAVITNTNTSVESDPKPE